MQTQLGRVELRSPSSQIKRVHVQLHTLLADKIRSFNREKQMTTINAFHPDYVKTYHPELLTSIKLESAQHANGSAAGAKAKATREHKQGKSAFTINKFPETQAARRKLLDVTVFHTYSKAGTANTTKKKKAA